MPPHHTVHVPVLLVALFPMGNMAMLHYTKRYIVGSGSTVPLKRNSGELHSRLSTQFDFNTCTTQQEILYSDVFRTATDLPQDLGESGAAGRGRA